MNCKRTWLLGLVIPLLALSSVSSFATKIAPPPKPNNGSLAVEPGMPDAEKQKNTHGHKHKDIKIKKQGSSYRRD